MHNADAAFHCPAGPQSGALVPRYLAGLVPPLVPQKAATIRDHKAAPLSASDAWRYLKLNFGTLWAVPCFSKSNGSFC